MRLEYAFALDQVEVPRFSVEAVEGIGKVFTLAVTVLNVLSSRGQVDLVFHGLNPDDPARKIEAFKRIVDSAESGFQLQYGAGQGGSVPGSSSYYQWVKLRRLK
jgi:hypothetical protein